MLKGFKMKQSTADTIGNTMLGGSIITSGVGAANPSFVQMYYSELMLGVALAGLVVGGIAKYYAYKLNRERFEYDKMRKNKP